MLLRKGKAAVYRREPFTIILKYEIEEPVPPVELRIDPGSRTTGIVVVGKCKKGDQVVWACELEHRGLAVRDALTSRRAIRRGRRNRHTRYRQPRFDNRSRSAGWLPPSLMSRVNNVVTWAGKLNRIVPVASIAVETVRFDTQALQNPEISGVEYQRGTLFGYEVREYLLQKWGRKCAYCGAENVQLEIEHIIPKKPI
jgi:5-methylcytosine-specific restriction endonuclease McrA